jgi:hypothetical protein
MDSLDLVEPQDSLDHGDSPDHVETLDSLDHGDLTVSLDSPDHVDSPDLKDSLVHVDTQAVQVLDSLVHAATLAVQVLGSREVQVLGSLDQLGWLDILGQLVAVAAVLLAR